MVTAQEIKPPPSTSSRSVHFAGRTCALAAAAAAVLTTDRSSGAVITTTADAALTSPGKTDGFRRLPGNRSTLCNRRPRSGFPIFVRFSRVRHRVVSVTFRFAQFVILLWVGACCRPLRRLRRTSILRNYSHGSTIIPRSEIKRWELWPELQIKHDV